MVISEGTLEKNNYPLTLDEVQELQGALDDLRVDNAIVNLHLGLGVAGRDKLASTTVGNARSLNYDELNRLWKGNSIIGNLVELLPDAMTSEYVIYECDNQDLTIWMQTQLEIARPYINESLRVARCQGGAGLVLYADDGNISYSKELKLNKLFAIEGYKVFASHSLPVGEWEDDIRKPTYDEAKYYQINGELNKQIHASRILPFHGIRLSSELRKQNNGWGDSVVTRAFEKINNLDQSDSLIANSLQSFNQAVLGIKNLAEKLDRDRNKLSHLTERVRTMAFLLSALGITMLDADHEKYDILSRDYNSIPQLLEHFKQMAAGACDIPLTLLLNRSPSGLTSGSSEAESWANYVHNRQGTDMMPQLNHLIGLLHLCKSNPTNGTPPSWFKVKRPSIHKLTAHEEADLEDKRATAELKKAQSANILIQATVYDPIEVAKARKENIPLDSAIDIEQRLEQFKDDV